VLALSRVLDRQVFTVGSREFRWSDVAENVDWDALRRKAAVTGDAVDEVAAEEAGRRWRYDRNLVAGEEMEAWLEHWDLEVADWRAFIRRSVSTEAPATTEAGERELWAEAVCSGELERAARDLAAREAATEAAGGMDALRASVCSERELQGLLAAMRADWIRVDCRTLTLPSENAALEAALCVRDDGLALAEVAEQAGAELAAHRLILGDTDKAFSDALMSARTGELLGPLPVGERWVLILVEEKSDPTIDDLEIRQRLEQEAMRRALEREVVNRVRWHERV
jgi:hypothetical protein